MMNLRVSAKPFKIRGVLAKKNITNSKCKKPSHTPACKNSNRSSLSAGRKLRSHHGHVSPGRSDVVCCTPAAAIEHLLTTNLRFCQNARHKTPGAAADMKLRYAAMLYTRAKTLFRKELDWQHKQVAGGGGRARPKGSSTHSSENMPTSEHAMELEDTTVPMTVISCRQREKPVVSMSSSSITRCKRPRCRIQQH